MLNLIRAHAALLFAGVATFVMMGAGQSLFGPTLPVYARLYALEDGQSGLLVSVLWVGCFLGVALMYLRGGVIGPRHALAAMALGAAGMAAIPGWGLTLVAAAVFGVGYGMSTAVFNPRVMRAFGRHGPSMLSLLNATFGVGAIAAPLVFVGLGSDPAWAFGLTAGLAVAIWLGAGPAGREGQAPMGEVKAPDHVQALADMPEWAKPVVMAAFKAAIKTPVKADATDVRPGQSRPAR